MSEIRQFTVAADDDGIRLDRWFKRHLPDTSFTTVAMWARSGQLRVDGARATPGDRIVAGQTLRVPPPEPAPVAGKPKRERPPLSEEEVAFAQDMVIHRDAQALVLNKPPGLATQGGTKTTQHVDGLLDALTFGAEGRPKLVHRLDKDTSGALLVARTSRAAAFFAKAFSGRNAKKTYWALVVGVPSIDDGMIELPIAKQPGTGGEKMHVDEAEGSPSRSRYRVIERAGNRAAWVELTPYTGRTHQLRVHMSAIGHPIVGDGKYGGPAAFLTGGISRKMHLHSRRIAVDHPDGGGIEITADLPAHFAESLATLGFEQMLGDTMPLDTPPPPTKADQKARAKAHAKSVRKDRKGERRNRGAAAEPRRGADKSKAPGTKRPGPKKPGAKSPARRSIDAGPPIVGHSLMHPNAAFRWEDRDAMRALVTELGFGTVFAATPDGPRVAHVPVVWLDDATLGLHLARGNGIVRHLDGASAVFSALGPDGYISPDYYGLGPDQVPTWNYVAVELEGTMRRMDDDALLAQIDRLTAEQEARLTPKEPWTRAKMDPALAAKLVRAIVGFRLEIVGWRGTLKLGQNKPDAARLAAADGAEAAGRRGIAHWMRNLDPESPNS